MLNLSLLSHENERLHKEYLAINRIKADTKYFLQYAKKYCSTKTKVGPLINAHGDFCSKP